jgi:hypothetical protein
LRKARSHCCLARTTAEKGTTGLIAQAPDPAIPPPPTRAKAEQTDDQDASVRLSLAVRVLWRPDRRPAPHWAGRWRRDGFGRRGRKLGQHRLAVGREPAQRGQREAGCAEGTEPQDIPTFHVTSPQLNCGSYAVVPRTRQWSPLTGLHAYRTGARRKAEHEPARIWHADAIGDAFQHVDGHHLAARHYPTDVALFQAGSDADLCLARTGVPP